MLSTRPMIDLSYDDLFFAQQRIKNAKYILLTEISGSIAKQAPTNYGYNKEKASERRKLFNKLCGSLIEYLDLDNDWDGYNGKPPSNQAVFNALDFANLLESLPNSENFSQKIPIPAPKPMIAGTGEVGLYWDVDGVYVDIGFMGNGTYSYYAEGKNSNESSEDEVSIKEIPSKLFNILKTLAV